MIQGHNFEEILDFVDLVMREDLRLDSRAHLAFFWGGAAYATTTLI